jgi:hypothetical protein
VNLLLTTNILPQLGVVAKVVTFYVVVRGFDAWNGGKKW